MQNLLTARSSWTDGTEAALEHGSKTLMASRIVDAIAVLLRGSGG